MKHPSSPHHGWLVLDKPLHMSSFQAVARVRRLLGVKKAGHAGTLDPLASGVLPIAIGEATKTMRYAQDTYKEYSFTIAFGEARDTDDLEGVVTDTSLVLPRKNAILAALPAFTGTILQSPPIYSAIKIDGKRSYALAREGRAEPLPPRPVTIHSIECTHYAEDGSEASFHLACGKGTYIRSFARDLAHFLGTYGHITALRRTKVGKFSVIDAISLDKLEEIVHSACPYAFLLSVETVLDDIPVIFLHPEYKDPLRQGKSVPAPAELPHGTIASAMIDGTLIALGIIEEARFKPNRVFNY